MAINLNLEKYGAQFKAFVDFAQSANDEDTLACIEGENEVALLDPEGKPRTIVAKTDDDRIKSFWKNQFFNRSTNQERLNNAVRDLFKETVFKVCGAKSFRELPQAVRDVMKEKDYGADGGHPLSARRILAVTRAIQAIAGGETVNKSVSMEKASQFVDGAVAYVSNSRADYKAYREGKFEDLLFSLKIDPNEKTEVELTDDQRGMAARQVSAHGEGLADGALRLLANYTVTAIAIGKYAGEDEISAGLADLAKTLKNVRTFRADDPKMSQLSAKLDGYWQDLLEFRMQNKRNFFDGVSSLFRQNYTMTIGGEKFVKGKSEESDATPKGKLMELVKNPEHRKAITVFMSLDVDNAFTAILRNGKSSVTNKYENGIDVKDVKGFDNVLRGIQDDNVKSSNDDVEFTLTLSDDGKKATVTARQTTNFKVYKPGEKAFSLAEAAIGKANLELSFEFDLSEPEEATLVKTSISQTIDAGEGVPAKAPEAKKEVNDNPIIDNNINAGKGDGLAQKGKLGC